MMETKTYKTNKNLCADNMSARAGTEYMMWLSGKNGRELQVSRILRIFAG